jgi:hypothetical protein
LKLDVDLELVRINMGFDLVIASLRALRKQPAFHKSELDQFRSLSQEARAATNSYLSGVLEAAETAEAGRPVLSTSGTRTKRRAGELMGRHAPRRQGRSSPFHRSFRGGKALWSCLCLSTEPMNVVAADTMTNDPYILFNKTPDQLRRIGARGGKAHGRNQRGRRAVLGHRQTVEPTPPPRETAGEAITRLDEQFPWLRGAEKRVRSTPPNSTHCEPISTPRGNASQQGCD